MLELRFVYIGHEKRNRSIGAGTRCTHESNLLNYEIPQTSQIKRDLVEASAWVNFRR
jgi:hypothetical protein